MYAAITLTIQFTLYYTMYSIFTRTPHQHYAYQDGTFLIPSEELSFWNFAGDFIQIPDYYVLKYVSWIIKQSSTLHTCTQSKRKIVCADS